MAKWMCTFRKDIEAWSPEEAARQFAVELHEGVHEVMLIQDSTALWFEVKKGPYYETEPEQVKVRRIA